MDKHSLKNNIGREINHFNNDDAGVTTAAWRDKGHKLIFAYEKIAGEYGHVDKYYIVHLDEKGKEMVRYDFMSPSVTSVYWEER